MGMVGLRRVEMEMVAGRAGMGMEPIGLGAELAMDLGIQMEGDLGVGIGMEIMEGRRMMMGMVLRWGDY